MTRIELEEWCEKFLKDIFENSKPAIELTMKLVAEEIDEEQFARELKAVMINSKTYTDYKKQLADFIVEHALVVSNG